MVGTESRAIRLTAGAIKNNKLNIRACGLDFFPEDVFGGSSDKHLGNQITINAVGLLNPIKTDIPTDKNTGKPRWIFRRRSWLKEFVCYHKLKPDDTVRINRVSERKYEVIPENNHGQPNQEQLLIKAREGDRRTNEERRVRPYRADAVPTKANEVTHDTPLTELNLNWWEKDLPEQERTKHVHVGGPILYFGKFRWQER